MIPEHSPIGPSRARWAELCPAGPRLAREAAERGLAVNAYEEDAEEGHRQHREAAKDPLVLEYLATVAPAEGRISEHWELELPIGNPVLTWGRADYVARYPSHVVILDLKTGHGDLDLETARLQLALYATAFSEPVSGYVFSPASGFSRSWLFAFPGETLARYRAILERARDPKAEPSPGYVQCRYCPAKAICPAWGEAIEVMRTFEPELREVGAIEPEELSRYLELAALAEPWAKTFKSAMKNLWHQGVRVPGWELATRPHSSVAYKAVIEGLAGQRPEVAKDLMSLMEANTRRTTAEYWKRVPIQKEITDGA